MEANPLQGQCKICNKNYSKSAMTKHFSSKCVKGIIEPENPKDSYEFFIILVENKYDPIWWLYIAINQDSSLSDLDQFLRNVWLECCGHLSEFEINKVYYNNDRQRDGSKTMNTRLGEVLVEKTKFEYVYDFGTSTNLALNVKSIGSGYLPEGIVFLAQNEKPVFECLYCEQNASELMCTDCKWQAEDWLFCNSCKKKHQCGEDFYIPIANSPRMGQCGYVGSVYE